MFLKEFVTRPSDLIPAVVFLAAGAGLLFVVAWEVLAMRRRQTPWARRADRGVREELRGLNATFDCENFQAVPRTLTAIARRLDRRTAEGRR